MTVWSYLMEVQREPLLKVWETEAAAAAEAAAQWVEASLIVRTVRGGKMRSTPAVMDEVSAALQFPYYFGENWAAFDECLADMECLSRAKGIIVLVRDAEFVLVDEDDEELEAFVAALRSASDEYGEPVELGESWDRPAVPFHVVLQTSANAEETARRWVAAGAQVDVIG